jgi:hypothetical protein
MTKPDEDETASPPSRVRWLVGWVLIPGAIVSSLFLAGVHVGARHPDMWLSRAMLWLFG